MVRWLRLCAPNAGGPGLIPCQGTRSCMLQLRPSIAKSIIFFLQKAIINAIFTCLLSHKVNYQLLHVFIVLTHHKSDGSKKYLTYLKIFIFIFIYLAALGLSYSTWDLVPWSEIEPGLSALIVQSLSYWTTREIPAWHIFDVFSVPVQLNMLILLNRTIFQPFVMRFTSNSNSFFKTQLISPSPGSLSGLASQPPESD